MNHIYFMAKQLCDAVSGYFTVNNNDIGVARRGLVELIQNSSDNLSIRQYKRMLAYLELYDGNKEIENEKFPIVISHGTVTPHD